MKIFLLLMLVALNCQAETLKTAWMGCTTPQLAEEYYSAAHKKDIDQIKALANSGKCIIISAKEKISVIEKYKTWHKVRVYRDYGTFEVILFGADDALD